MRQKPGTTVGQPRHFRADHSDNEEEEALTRHQKDRAMFDAMREEETPGLYFVRSKPPGRNDS